MNAITMASPKIELNSETLISQVSDISRGQLATLANRIDHEGYYPLDIMARIGKTGALGAHLNSHGQRFDLALASMHEITRSCGSTGFLMWCHHVCGLYMEQSGNPALLARLPAHAAGQTFGGTALSNPMKSFAGIESMVFRAKKVPGGYRVSGTLPWVSHIAHGQYCGAIAKIETSDGSTPHEIMFLLDLDQTVDLGACPEFSGMEGTSTWKVQLQDFFVGYDNLIADPARPFIARIRSAFVLLQAGMATGLVEGSIDSIREVEPVLGHVNHFLHDRADQLQAELDELNARVAIMAKTPFDDSKDFFINVLDARCQGAELALRATQSALLHQGARGYLRSAAPQRRIREAHFVAIVTPAIKHLRWEMSRMMKEEMPK
ncbi:acyl-CoA dehydrogenase family protein [Pseudomonas putida]|uniref:acyl-CoA dehydrogenase family protein n=1 Tax=Pseudomonas putida TaxID=303 RepID=UPI0002DC9D08|nr:acyl-CoA dehydrogenase family protein [Pseudomonas putida]